MRRSRDFLVLAVAAALLSGCATQRGPNALPSARINYNEAISRSWNEQMLLNLVRLRYRDNPQFLEVSGVTTQLAFSAGAGANGSFDLGPGGNGAGAFASVGYTERPTISYSPLQGEDFARRVLAPLEPRVLTLLSQSGWSIQRLMLCCVQQINTLKNAPSAAGPTPDYVPPHYKDFYEASALLRDLQIAGRLQAAIRRNTAHAGAGAEEGGGDHRLVIVLQPPDDSLENVELHQKLARFRELLGLAGERDEFEITDMVLDRSEAQIAVRGRSLMATLFFLSQAVEVPSADEEAGRVTVTKFADGSRFDWKVLFPGGIFRVRTDDDEPTNAAVKVNYRGHWFYIDDSDLNSKTTFGLLKYLFSLQSAPSQAATLLTISAGN